MSNERVALNKMIAVEKSVKSTTHKRLAELQGKLAKASLLSGISRTYRPKDDDGDMLPAEENRVQLRATDALRQVNETIERLFDVVATKDWGNTEARADVVVNGETVVAEVPVTYLLFLEKQLSELRATVERLPVLDASEAWEWDANQNCFATKPVETHRTKKLPRVLVKYEATEEHPAQTEVWHEDVVVGLWRTVKYSGALQAERVDALVKRVDALLEAVKFAREEANKREVEQVKVGRKVLDWIFN